jgi:hypothetical protein
VSWTPLLDKDAAINGSDAIVRGLFCLVVKVFWKRLFFRPNGLLFENPFVSNFTSGALAVLRASFSRFRFSYSVGVGGLGDGD